MKKKIYSLLLMIMSVAILGTVCVRDVSAAPENEAGSTTLEGEETFEDEHILNYRELPNEIMPESITVRGEDAVPRLRSTTVPRSYGYDREHDNYDQISGYLPPLRDQNPFGSCWAHAAMGLAEINLRKKNLNPADLSELHLSYFTYNHVPDPLGGTTQDVNRGIYSDEADNYLDLGGNLTLASNVLSSWTGAASETGTLVYPISKDSLPATLSSGLAYDDWAHLVRMSKVLIKGENEDVAAAKRLIMNNGAIGVSYYSPSGTSAAVGNNLYNSRYNAFYDPQDHGRTNHSVIAVGWDDDFPKEYFSQTPPDNGAWLIRNSWTTGSITENQSYAGYFWMSYYTTDLSEKAFSYEFDTATNYEHNYQYDGAMADGWGGMGRPDLKVANVFTARGAEDLKAVSFSTSNTNLEYTVDIYRHLPADDTFAPGSATPAQTESGTTGLAGYITIPLSSDVPLDANERFGVVITLHKAGDEVKIDAEYSYRTDWYQSVAHADDGQSFLWNGARWIDFGHEHNINIRIKAFTNDRTEEPIDLADDETLITVANVAYTGTAVEPPVTVTNGGVTLDPAEYDVTYNNNTDVGDNATVTVRAKAGSTKCTGVKTVRFTIDPASLNRADVYFISGRGAQRRHGVTLECPSVIPVREMARHYILTFNGQDLTEGVDYRVKDPNTFFRASDDYQMFYVEGMGRFTGEKPLSVGVDPTDISPDPDNYGYQSTFVDEDFFYYGAAASIADQYYNNGDPVTPTVLNLENRTIGRLTLDDDYEIIGYGNNIQPGTATVTVRGINNFSEQKTYQFTIRNKLFVTLEQNGTLVYNGSPQRANVNVTSNVETDEISFLYSDSQSGTYTSEIPEFTEAGVHTVYFKATAVAAGCENEVTDSFLVLIESKPLSVTWSTDDSWKYDGTSHGVTATLTGVCTGDTVTPVTEGLTAVNVGDYTARVTGIEGADSDNYALPSEPPVKTYSITRRRVILTSASARAEYTGNPLTREEISVTGDGFVTGQGVDITYTGVQTGPGESYNTFTYTYKSGTVANNYRIETEYGTLTVDWWDDDHARDHMHTIRARSATVEYSGQEQSVSGFEPDTESFVFEAETYTISGLTAQGRGTNVGTYPVSVTGSARVTDSDGDNVTSHFLIDIKSGILTITGNVIESSDITLGEQLVYTGNEQTQTFTVRDGTRTLVKGTDYEVTGDKATTAGEHTLTVTGKGGYIGSASKTYTIALRDMTGVSVSQSGTMTYSGGSRAPSVRAVADQDGVTFTYAKSSGATYTSEIPTFSDAGKYTVYYRAEKTGYKPKTGSFTVTVEKAGLGISWGDTSFKYDGNTHVPTAKATGVLGSDSITYTVSGASKAAGTHTAEVTGMSGSASNNYELPSNRSTSYTITKSDSGSGSSSGSSSGSGSGGSSNSSSGSSKKSTSSGSGNASSGSKTTASSGKSNTSSGKSNTSSGKSNASSGKSTASSGEPAASSKTDASASGTDKTDSKDKKTGSSDKLEDSVKLADKDSALKTALGEEKYKELTEGGKEPDIRLDVKPMDEDKVSENEKKIVEDNVEKHKADIPGLKIGRYLDINLEVNEGGDWVKITELGGKLRIAMDVTDDLRQKGDRFWLLHIHGEEGTLLEDVDDDPDRMAYDVDSFSTFVLLYSEKEENDDKPAALVTAEEPSTQPQTVPVKESAPDTGSEVTATVTSNAEAASPAADSDMWRIWLFAGLLVVTGAGIAVGINWSKIKKN